jgi:NADH-quinone oxidoreductase subunit M
VTTAFSVPWVELAILIPVVGAVCVGRMRDLLVASRLALFFAGADLACALMAAAGVYADRPAVRWDFFPRIHGQPLFALDELSAPLFPLVALLHFLTALATARTKMRRFSFAWSQAAEALRLAAFACLGPWVTSPEPVFQGPWTDLVHPFEPFSVVATPSVALFYTRLWLFVGLVVAGTVSPYFELRSRNRPTRVYVVHMGLFAGLLIAGAALLDPAAARDSQPAAAAVMLLLAVLVRCGVVPVHCWMTDWFEHATFGNALLYVAPLIGVYAALRLVLPIAPDWALAGIGWVSLVTAVYAAGMAIVQREARRFFAYLFLSHSSLVLVGLELHTPVSLTGALSLWVAVALSLGGFGLTLRALEARFGRLSLTEFHGLYEHSPSLAVCFLLTGLTSVGFPGTLGFVASEVLVDGAIEANVGVGVAVVAAAALNGIAVVRAYFLLFTGKKHVSTVALNIGPRERFAVLTLAALLIGGGLYPQRHIASRLAAAEAVLKTRKNPPPQPESPPRQH